MDPLSEILSLLKPRSYVSAGFDAGGDWCLDFAAPAGIKFNAVMAGACWLQVAGEAQPVRLEAGDCFLLPRGRPFRLASDLALPPIDAGPVFAGPRVDGIIRFQGGGAFFLAGSRFLLSGRSADILLGELPAVVHVRKEQDQAILRWALERMRQELQAGMPGSSLVAEHLAHIMLVQALRLHLTGGTRDGTGWLAALADRQIGAAIGLLHGDPARRWTVAALAGQVGMSRTAFAVRFRQVAGRSPIDYLARWRMLLAADRLTGSDAAVAAIAAALGYESESAFGVAFRRIMGCSPRQYARAPSAGGGPPADGAGGPDPDQAGRDS